MKTSFATLGFLLLILPATRAAQVSETLLLVSSKDILTNSIRVYDAGDFEQKMGCQAYITFRFRDMPPDAVRRIHEIHHLHRIRISHSNGGLVESGWIGGKTFSAETKFIGGGLDKPDGLLVMFATRQEAEKAVRCLAGTHK